MVRIFISACIVLLAAGAADAGGGDPQIKTDHPWYPGELSCSTFERLFATQAELYKRVTGVEVKTDEQKALAAWFWRFEPDPADRPPRMDWPTLKAMPTTPVSIAISKELKKRGWSFVGPTTVYAFMQAMGLVNDHLDGCAFREPVEEARRLFGRP